MRLRLRFGLAAALVLGGCGGGAAACTGGDQLCPVAITSYTFEPAPSWQTPAAPIPVGTSIDAAFVEQKCTSSSNSRRPLPGTGCTAPYPAPAIVATPMAMADGRPCPLTIDVVATGTIRITRTAPGDPMLRAGSAGLPGYCAVQVTDPGRGAWVIVL
jgi:hypothetical protein